MALFEVKEYDKKIYEEQLRDFLPDNILDVHTHVWLDKYVDHAPVAPGEKRTVAWPSLVALDDSIEDLLETFKLLFPGKNYRSLMFTSEGGWDKNNQYVAEASKKTGFPALYFSRPEESADEIERKIREGGFLGLKSYLSLSAAYIPTKEIRVFDFFPKYQLERLNEMGGIMMLHIPRDGRLKDPVNIAQILEIKREFPRIRLIIAHIGRAYTRNDIGNAFELLNQEPTLTYDFTANCSDYAIEQVIKNAGVKNVMYGSDFPILRMRTHRIEENDTYINLVPPGLYGDPKADPHLREVTPEEAEKITFFAYEELLAFKRVAEKLHLTREDIEDIMCNNAQRLVDGARKDIYGI